MALRLGGGWRGALIRGPSGSGKSDLALRALEAGFRLVADDRVRVWRSGGRLWGCAPPPLHGLCEARGQAIHRLAALGLAAVDLIVDLAGEGEALERLPDPQAQALEGVRLPRIRLHGREASAPARLRLALQASVAHAAMVRL